MNSTASQLGKLIDCRKLIITGGFYALAESARSELVKDFVSGIQELLTNGVVSWSSDRKTVRNAERVHESIETPGPHSILFFGDFESDVVYHKTSLKKYDRTMKNWPYMDYVREAVDYKEYYEANLEYSEDGAAQFKVALLKLFEEEQHQYIAHCCSHDVEGMILSYQVKPLSDLYYGKLYAEIQTFCLGDAVYAWANRFKDLGIMLSEKYHNINLRIEINAYHDVNETYFGRATVEEDALKNTLLRSVCLSGIGWCNIVSQKTMCLGNINQEENNLVKTTELRNGNMVFQAQTPIDCISSKELKLIKNKLTGAVLPSQSSFHFTYPFRRCWEKIAVFEDELTVVGAKVIFCHKGSMTYDAVSTVLRE